jgi:hypothetical protein
MSKLSTKIGNSFAPDPIQAVQELAQAIHQPDTCLVIFFASSKYDLPALEQALTGAFSCPVIGCTSVGEITSRTGYTENSIVGVSLSSSELIVHPRLIMPLHEFNASQGEQLAQSLRRELQTSKGFNPKKMFGLLLVDGMSMLEEKLVATLHNSLGGVTFIGGSAADDFRFDATYVYFNGKFHANAAVITLFETNLPFKAFQIHHYEPTDIRLVITESDSDLRIVSEINGYPAAEEYARIIGVSVADLSPALFGANPLMLKVDGDYYLRTLQKANPDGSLTLYCAIDTGLVLTVGRGKGQAANLEKNLAQLRRDLPTLNLVLGFDCFSRRLELQARGWTAKAEELLKGINFIGFSTYGEQFNGLHVTQTLTGIAIGDVTS